jgi:hypothetical protein
VIRAPWFGLDDLVDAASADLSIERMTLVNLDVPYSTPETWQPEHLARLKARALGAGWSLAGSSRDGSRQLRILSPVAVKYFAF